MSEPSGIEHPVGLVGVGLCLPKELSTYQKLALAAFITGVSLFSFAADMSDIMKSYALPDGSTVHVFKDGKMAVENPFGRAVSVKEGQVLEAKDGTRVTVKGNEIFRLDHALNADRREG